MSRDDCMRYDGVRLLIRGALGGVLAVWLSLGASPGAGQDRFERSRSVMRARPQTVSQSKAGGTAAAQPAPDSAEEPAKDPAREPAQDAAPEAESAPPSALRQPGTNPSAPGAAGEPKPAQRRPATSAAPPGDEPPVPTTPRYPRAPATDIEPDSAPRRPADDGSTADIEYTPAPELLEEPWAEPLRPGCGWWGTAEYLLWWRSGSSLPPLVTSSPSGTPATAAGVLGAGAFVIYGDQVVGNQARPGGRLSLGSWADVEQTRGWQGRAWFLGKAVSNFSASQADFPILARPFLDVSGPPEQNAFLVAFPPGQGNIQVSNEADAVGGDALWRQMIYVSPRSRVDLLLGYQFAHLNESLQINSVNDPSGAAFRVTDYFATNNEFHGGAIGLQFVYDRPGFRLDLLAKVGVGNMHQSVEINGQTNGAPNGLLAQATNIGLYSRNAFTAIPELGATLTWCVTDSVEFSCGYSLLLFPNVVQVENALDPNLAVNLSVPLVGPARPEFVFDDNLYWIHGLNIGVTWRY
ncbi:MAG: BBP7 family outer membrane beta-barrel protein [Pirellulales bacterium]